MELFARSVVLVLLISPLCSRADAASLEHRFYVSPAEIRNLDTRTLGELLVQRLQTECDLAGTAASGGKAVGDDADLIMMVQARTLASIAKYGFLNQHATLTTQGVYRIPDRFEAEQELAMIRLPYSHKGKELLPKYALFVPNRADVGSFPLPTRYGEAAVVFKKAVMKRATWTYADSSDFRFLAGRFNRGGAANPVLTRTALYRRKPEDKNTCGNYCEAQIWGKLSFEDVDYLMLREGEPAAPELLELGVPVYRFSPSTAVPAGYTRGELLAPRGPSRARVETAAALEPAIKNHLKDRERASLPDGDLIARAPYSLSDMGDLAARPKSPAVIRALEAAWKSSDADARSLSLYGLSELPWADFKPFLLDGLKEKNPLINVEAIAFAAEHLDDPEVTRLLDDLRRRQERDLLVTSDWLDRPGKPRSCD